MALLLVILIPVVAMDTATSLITPCWRKDWFAGSRLSRPRALSNRRVALCSSDAMGVFNGR